MYWQSTVEAWGLYSGLSSSLGKRAERTASRSASAHPYTTATMGWGYKGLADEEVYDDLANGTNRGRVPPELSGIAAQFFAKTGLVNSQNLCEFFD